MRLLGPSRAVARRLAVLGLAIAALMACLLPAPPARAQTQQQLEKARTLFRQGVALEAAGDWAGALSTFQEVAQVKLTPQVRFHIGRCKEQLGRLNEALGDYRLAEYEAGQEQLKELEQITKAREELEARIPKLVIKRGAGAELAQVQLDGVGLGERQLAQPVSVDPGPHTVVAKLGGKQFEQRVDVGERETKTVELVPPPGFGQTEPAPVAKEEPVTKSVQADVTSTEGGGSAVPWIIGAVGVGSLAASGVFFVLRNGAEQDLEDGCRDDVCPRSLEHTQDKGELYALLTNVTLGVGVVGVGVATYLLLTGGSDEAAPETGGTVRVRVAASPNAGGVSVGGRF